MSAGLDLMTEEERELARQCSQICFPASSTSALLSIRNNLGVNLTWKEEQIRYLTKKDRDVLYNLRQDASSAENLINSFSTRDDVNYLYVTFDQTEGMLLLTGKCSDNHPVVTLVEPYGTNVYDNVTIWCLSTHAYRFISMWYAGSCLQFTS